MPRSLGQRIATALVALTFALVAALWSRLPDPMPTHWNIDGKVDGFMPKPFGPLLLPATLLLVHAIFSVLPRVSPSAYEAPAQRRVMLQIQLSITAFLVVVTVSSLLVALGYALPWNRVLSASVGALVIALGISMARLPKNRVVGIRTPWTLANQEVWERTHALGARLFVLAGLVALVGGAMGLHLLPILVGLGLAAVAPAFYSFRLYRKVAGNEPPNPT